MPKNLPCMPPGCTWVTNEQQYGACFNFRDMYTPECYPALQCRKQPQLAMLCTVMVHFHILVHCVLTLTSALHASEPHMRHNRKRIWCRFSPFYTCTHVFVWGLCNRCVSLCLTLLSATIHGMFHTLCVLPVVLCVSSALKPSTMQLSKDEWRSVASFPKLNL